MKGPLCQGTPFPGRCYEVAKWRYTGATRWMVRDLCDACAERLRALRVKEPGAPFGSLERLDLGHFA